MQRGHEWFGLGIDRHQKPGAFGKLVAAAMHETRRPFVDGEIAFGECLRDMSTDRRQIGAYARADQKADEQGLQKKNEADRQTSGKDNSPEQGIGRQQGDPFALVEVAVCATAATVFRVASAASIGLSGTDF